MGPILRELCQQKGIGLLEGHVMPDHIHMCMSIPPKYAVAYTLGFLKGKSAIRVHRQYERSERVYGKHSWAEGYCVSTVGLDENMIRQYIQQQEKLETGQNALEFDQD